MPCSGHHAPGFARAAAVVAGLAFALAAAADEPPARPGLPAIYLSPVAVAADPAHRRLYVAESGARQISELDLSLDRVTRRFALTAAPNGLLLAPNAERLYVTCDGPEAPLCVIDLHSGRVAAVVSAGHTPMSPVLSDDGRRLYVCNRFDSCVVVIDATDGRVLRRIGVAREPVGMSLAGNTLVVAHHLPATAAKAAAVSATVSLIEVATSRLLAGVRLPTGSTGVRGLCLSPEGQFAYVTHTLGHYQLATTHVEFGWINTNALSVIDVAGRKLLNTVLLDEPTRGAANPWGIACSPDGRRLVIACAGTHELLVLDRDRLHQRLEQAALGRQVTRYSTSAGDVRADLTFLDGIRRRISLPGFGARSLALANSTAFVGLYFSDAVANVELDPDSASPPRIVALGPGLPETRARQGERLFNDATRCAQQWQSCASCHPDGRADGLNWDLLNDGFGNPKNARSLLFAHVTPPAMSLGVREEAEAAVRAGFRSIQFADVSEEEAAAVDEYLRRMQPVASPRRTGSELTPAARRGAALFESTGCAACHPPPLYTDLRRHDLGLGTGREQGLALDTPTLREVWRTAPYLHDGRAATLTQVFTEFNPDDRHGRTSGLAPTQLDDLVEFVLSQ